MFPDSFFIVWNRFGFVSTAHFEMLRWNVRKKWSFFAFFPKFSSYFIFGTHESFAWRIKHIPNNNKYICGQFQTGSVQVRLIPFSLQNPPIWPFSRKIGKIVKLRLRHQGWRYPTSESGNKSCSACLTTWYSPFYSIMTSKICLIAGGGTLNSCISQCNKKAKNILNAFLSGR